jgi:hypothetical protein
LNPEIRAQQFKWAQPIQVEAKPSGPALSFGAEAKPFENLVLTIGVQVFQKEECTSTGEFVSGLT